LAPSSVSELLNRFNDCRLKPYLLQAGTPIVESARHGKGFTFTVEVARQGGKNELSAQMEMILLMLDSTLRHDIVKCAPTFQPQSLISMRRLTDRLDDAKLPWVAEQGHIVRIADSRVVFLSAEETANVVGNTAHLLLEVDKAQDVPKEHHPAPHIRRDNRQDVYNKKYGKNGTPTNLNLRGVETMLVLELVRRK
jgi:hypothetical protein